MNKSNDISTCANCGKGEEESSCLRTCTACKLVKYCNRECQIAHRPQHKKECKQRAAELHDEKLFKQPPTRDCPICFLPMPINIDEVHYNTCCGKMVCGGCMWTQWEYEEVELQQLCPFCRASNLNLSDEEYLRRMNARVDAGDEEAMAMLGAKYSCGQRGLTQDHYKAMELWTKAAKMGSFIAVKNIATAYNTGRGVQRNRKKEQYHHELAAIMGDVGSRERLAHMEHEIGNYERAYKHWIIAAKGGDIDCMNSVEDGYADGHVTKDELEETLCAYKESASLLTNPSRERVKEWATSNPSSS